MPGTGSIATKYANTVADAAASDAVRAHGNTVPPDAAVLKLDVDLLDDNPFQPRRAIDEAQLGDLAASIAKSGLLQPVVVRPGQPGRYHLVAGHRRVAAFKKLKADATTDEERRKFRLIPAYVKRDLDDSQMAVGAYVENVQREALSPVEEASALARIKELVGATTAKEVAQSVGQPERRVRRLLRLNDAPAIIKESISQGVLVDTERAAVATAAEASGRARREHRKLDFIGALEFLRLHEHWFKEKPKSADERIGKAVRRALTEGWGVRRIQDFVDGIITGRTKANANPHDTQITRIGPAALREGSAISNTHRALLESSESMLLVRLSQMPNASAAELRELAEALHRLTAQVSSRLDIADGRQTLTNAGPARP